MKKQKILIRLLILVVFVACVIWLSNFSWEHVIKQIQELYSIKILKNPFNSGNDDSGLFLWVFVPWFISSYFFSTSVRKNQQKPVDNFTFIAGSVFVSCGIGGLFGLLCFIPILFVTGFGWPFMLINLALIVVPVFFLVKYHLFKAYWFEIILLSSVWLTGTVCSFYFNTFVLQGELDKMSKIGYEMHVYTYMKPTTIKLGQTELDLIASSKLTEHYGKKYAILDQERRFYCRVETKDTIWLRKDCPVSVQDSLINVSRNEKE